MTARDSHAWPRSALRTVLAPLAILVALGGCIRQEAERAPSTRSPDISATDPLVGIWELNVAQTHYGGGAEPRSQEFFICTPSGAGVKCTIQSLRPNGRSVAGGFAAAYDGTPGPTHGIPDVDHVRLTKVSGSIADATFTHRGRPVFAYRAVRSGNGRLLTVTSVDPFSRASLSSVVVYDQR